MKKYNFIKLSNMFNLLKGRNLIIALGLFLLSTQLVKAEDYYVSNTGGGGGTSTSDYASVTSLRTKLQNMGSVADKTLNVYFDAGSYSLPSAFRFGTAANILGAKITFQTVSGAKDVTFTASGTNYGFTNFEATGSATRANPFSFTVRNLIINGFTGVDFRMFILYEYYNLRFENCDFNNNTTNYRLFEATSSNSVMSFTGCTFSANRSSSYQLIFSDGANSPLSINNCVFTNNRSAISLIYNANGAFTITNSSFSSNTADSEPFFYSVGDASPLSISGSVFNGNSVATNRFIYNTGSSNSVSIVNSEFINNITSASEYLIDAYSPVIITNTKFSQHTTTRGILYTHNGNLSLSDLTVSDNTVNQRLIYNSASSSTTMTLSNSKFENNTTATGSGYYMIDVPGNFTVTNSEFINNTNFQRLLYCTANTMKITGTEFTRNKAQQAIVYASGSALVLSGSNFTENEMQTTSTEYSIVYNSVGSSGITTIYNNYFKGNSTSGNYSSIIRNVTSTSTIYKNTFSGNFMNGTNASVIWLASGTPTVHTNTFSENTGTYSIYLTTSNSTVANNTIYKSSDIFINGTNSGTIVKNNLLLGGDKINPSTATAGSYCSYNISNGRYHIGSITSGGILGGTDITNLDAYYDPNLSFYDPNRPPIHDLLLVRDPANPIIGKGDVSGIGPLVETDQKGSLRPTLSPISIGAIDYAVDLIGYPISETYTYRTEKGLTPMSIDFSHSLVLPTNASLTYLNIEIIGTFANGTLSRSPNNNYTYIFTPTADGVDPTKPDPGIIDILSTVNYTATYDNGVDAALTESNTLSVRVVDLTGDIPPGFLDEDLESCYGTMGDVKFSSAFRFKSNETSTGSTSEKEFVGFTVPLVGDLNGDKKPEIVALSGGGRAANAITILNGQTGELLHRMSLPSTLSQAVHCSPSSIVLVDSDENGLGEIVVVYPANSSGNNAGYLFSYEITSATDFTLKPKWQSDYPYHVSGDTFRKPLPQVLNFKGTGDPEILVYNRIYDAKTGKLKMTLETLADNDNAGSAFVGKDLGALHSYAYDRTHNFSFTYDMNWDGKYDIVAGGKIYYDFNFENVTTPTTSEAGTFKMVQMQNVPDGRTGVADINGDGIPDVVVVSRSGYSTDTKLKIIVWNPDFLYVDTDGSIKERPEASRTPYILAEKEIVVNGATWGNNSYVYIGDIDGQKDHKTGKMLPEIAILAGNLTKSSVSIHPNVISNFPSISGSTYPATSGASGVIFAMTWDDDPSIAGTDTANKLKLSFILEHSDRSANTGFTMFDFDNDGMQEICYRDEKTLRIIKANIPYIYLSDTEENKPETILFKEDVLSYTGFEFPAIADIDGDNSAEMVVMGSGEANEYWGHIYAVGNNGDKFAPALPVWNQGLYSPFKINEDLTVPKSPASNPLQYRYKRTRVKADGTTEVIDFQPFNGTLIQASRFMEIDAPEGTLFEPIVFFTDGYITDAKVEAGSPTSYVKFKIGNRPNAKTSISTNTPIRLYKTSVVGSEWVSDRFTLAGLGVASAIQGGQVSAELSIEIPDPYGIYVIRLADDTDNPTDTSPDWSYGTNSASGGNTSLGIGVARRYFRDCIWADNEVKVAKYVLNDDAYTIQEFTNTGFIDVIANDIIPTDMPAFKLSASDIISGPQAGILEFDDQAGTYGAVKYTHTGAVVLPDGIDKFVYEMTYDDITIGQSVTRQATVYIYILQSVPNGFAACLGESDYDLELKELPVDNGNIPEIEFHWYDAADVEIAGNPQSVYTIANVSANMQFKIRPQIISGPYMNVNFPKGDMTFYAIPQETEMVWTGAVNTNWNNPNNWTDGAGNLVGYAPRACVNVTLPTVDGSNTAIKNYPWLYNEAYANNIDIKSKAMIANTHYLTYNDATFEMLFNASERNRWVMYSAPFGKTYSGDYMFLNADNYPVKGAVYMSLFQSVNPDNPSNLAAKHQFSMTFSNVEKELPLGTGFILYIDGSKDAGNSSFKFPSPIDTYEYYHEKNWAGKPAVPPFSGVLSREATLPVGTRKANNRFITEMASAVDAHGAFDMPMTNDNITDSKIIMVTNPFNAYLKVDDFLAENATDLEQAYIVWNGAEQPGFIEYLKDRTVDDSYITTNGTVIANQLISPHQSFFVVRKTSATVPTSLTFKPEEMTVTSTTSAPYPLKLVVEAANVFRIKASYNNTKSYTAVLKSDEPNQTPKVFLNDEDKPGIDIYTIVENEAIAINSISDLSKEIPLGIRMAEGGSVILNFNGADKIEGYEIYLKDGENLIPLKDNEDYNLQIERPSVITTPYFEVNDRLSIVFKKKN